MPRGTLPRFVKNCDAIDDGEPPVLSSSLGEVQNATGQGRDIADQFLCRILMMFVLMHDLYGVVVMKRIDILTK